jgi:hypothetical protein
MPRSLMAVCIFIMKNAVFWDVTPCGCCKSRLWAERIASIIMLVTTNFVPCSLISSTVMMEAIHSSKTSVLTRATRRHIPEDGIPNRERHGYLNFNIFYWWN